MTPIWRLALLVMSVSVGAKYCPDFNTTGEPRFTKTPAHVDYVRVELSRSIHCCLNGGNKINWYRQDQNHTWKPFPESYYDKSRVLFPESDSNQTLVIKQTILADNTSFKCELSQNGVPVIENTLRLYVLLCDKLAKGPEPIIPSPYSQTIDKFGGNMTFPCTGYFGCEDEDVTDRFIEWKVKGQWQKAVEEIDPRYRTSKLVAFPGNVILQRNLTITSVQPVDLTRTFVCQLVSSQLVEGQRNIEVHITKRDEPNMLLIWVLVGGVSVILFLVIILTRKFYGPQICVFLGTRTRIKLFAPKVISGKELEQNAFVYHAVEDTQQATDIQEYLEKEKLKIKISHDIPGNKFVLRSVENEINISAMVLVIYSENLINDGFANVIIENLISNSKNHIFIELDQVDPPKDTPYLKFRSSVYRLIYPRENDSKRKKRKFFCSLIRMIPKFKEQIELERRKPKRKQREGSSSSAKALLHSPGPSPGKVDIPTQDDASICVKDEPSRFPFKGLEKEAFENDDAHRRNLVEDEENIDRKNVVDVEIHLVDEDQGFNNKIVESETGDEAYLNADEVQQAERVYGSLSKQTSNDSGNSEVFLMSQEITSSMDDKISSASHRIENETDPNISGRGYQENESKQATKSQNIKKQNPNIHLEIKGNNSQQNSCSSPESGYTSMSPERQRDLEKSFELKHSNSLDASDK